MAELLDPDGVWDEELIALMLAVAIEVEADQAEAMFGATAAAVASAFGKEAPEAFRKGLESVRAQVRGAQREARGLEPVDEEVKAAGGEEVAETMLEIFGKMGLRAPRPRGGRGPGPGGKGGARGGARRRS